MPLANSAALGLNAQPEGPEPEPSSSWKAAAPRATTAPKAGAPKNAARKKKNKRGEWQNTRDCERWKSDLISPQELEMP